MFRLFSEITLTYILQIYIEGILVTMVDNLNYMFIKDARILFKWSLCVFLGKLVLNQISVIFLRAEPELDRYMGSEELLLVMSKLVHCFACIFNATAICVLSDIFQHFRRNKRRYIDGVLLLLLSRFSQVQLCATPQMAAHQAPLSLGFSRQEYWSGLPLPSPKACC